MAPVKELEALRMNHRAQEKIGIYDGKEVPLEGVKGDTLELALEIDPGQARQVGVKIRRSPDGEEETPIVYDAEKKTLRIELAKSTQAGYLQHLEFVMASPNPPVTAQEAPFELAESEPLKLRIFLDHSIVEVFANERQALVQRIDPSRPDSLGISLFATGGDAEVTRLEAWDMAPSNPM